MLLLLCSALLRAIEWALWANPREVFFAATAENFEGSPGVVKPYRSA